MFCLGGSLCPPLLRRTALPDTDPLDWPAEIDRALVLGGNTDWLLAALVARDCEITVLESAEHVAAAQRWARDASVVAFDDRGGLNDFAANWFDVVFLLGGTLNTGGPFAPNRHLDWAQQRGRFLEQAEELLSNRGAIVHDALPTVDPVARTLMCHVGDDGGLTLVESTVTTRSDGSEMFLRTSRFRGDGVLDDERVDRIPWVPWRGYT